MLTCSSCFFDYITRCDSVINMKAVLQPSTEYTWKIQDKFQNEYEGTFTTDEDGYWQIPVADLPPGLLTEFGGRFRLQVYNTNCRPANMLIAQEFDCIEFEVRGGTSTKDFIGCPVTCVSSVGDQAELIPFLAASDVTIPWTPGRDAVFGDAPTVEVFHLISGTIYSLVQVQVERTTVDGQLSQLKVINVAPTDGYVLIS